VFVRELHEARNENTKPTFTVSDTFWVASILEVRAKDGWTVFARIEWFYRPDDLPDGRQPYHGTNEIIKSPWQDIIDVRIVTSRANVTHWNEEEDTQDAENISGLYWRRTLDLSRV